MSCSNCCFLICIQISQEAGQVVWYSHLLKNFPQFVVIHTVKAFGIVNKAEVDVFLELCCFFNDPTDKKCKSKLKWDPTSHRSERPSLKSVLIVNAGEGVEKGKPSYSVDENVNWCSHDGKRNAGSLKTKNRATIWPSNPIPGRKSRENHTGKDTHTPVFTATLFTSAKTEKQPGCPSTEERARKTWCVCPVDCRSAV